MVGLRVRRWQPVLAAHGKREARVSRRASTAPIVLLASGAVHEMRLPAQCADASGSSHHPAGPGSIERLAANEDIGKPASSHLLGLGRLIRIANMAVYLASDESEITTGQILSVDSGVTIY